MPNNAIANSIINKEDLPLLPKEFCEALVSEIEAARENSIGNAIPLSNGRKIDNRASLYQYSFLLDSILNLPEGSPGDLYVPGQLPLETILVSINGLKIVISISKDIGEFIPSASLKCDLTFLLKKLIDRIQINAQVENLAGKRMLGLEDVTGEPVSVNVDERLNFEQKSAVESAVGRNMTIIWGPPGTGKTVTIGAIVKAMFEKGRSVLIVSHTNTAVDGAILKSAEHISGISSESTENGTIIRIGVVKNSKLHNDYPNIILTNQVEFKSKELNNLKCELEEKKDYFINKIQEYKRKKDLNDWLSDYDNMQQPIFSAIEKFFKLNQEEKILRSDADDLKTKIKEREEEVKVAEEIYNIEQKICKLREQKKNKEETYKSSHHKLEQLERDKEFHKNRLLLAQEIEEKRKELSNLRSAISMIGITATPQSNDIASIERNISFLKNDLSDLMMQYNKSKNAIGLLKQIFQRISPETILEKINQITKSLEIEEEKLSIKQEQYLKSQNLNKDLNIKYNELSIFLAGYSNIRDYEEELNNYNNIVNDIRKYCSIKVECEDGIISIDNSITNAQEESEELRRQMTSDPQIVLTVYSEDKRKLNEKYGYIGLSVSKLNDCKSFVDPIIKKFLQFLYDQGIIDHVSYKYDEVTNVLVKSYLVIKDIVGDLDEGILDKLIAEFGIEISKIDFELNSINQKLKEIELSVISNATIIGTTLTKTYMSDELFKRKFDTIILDEASMAPIPALWAASLLTKENIVIVGDYKQLPPIALSNKDIAKRWLHRDIFEVSGIKEKNEKHNPPKYFISLKVQMRMKKEIADIANRYYGNILTTHPCVNENEKNKEFSKWYKDTRFKKPVTLIDTGSLNAWVTSVAKNGKSSRLNFLSAVLSVNLADSLLTNYNEVKGENSETKILIISPYRPHAKLVSLLIKENKTIENKALSGTVHSFQGTEADVVIFDLVVDEPHYRVNLFMPDLDEDMKRLFTVSITRARYRLFIIGDFDYYLQKGKKSELGKEKGLISYLFSKNYPRIDAKELMPRINSYAANKQLSIYNHERINSYKSYQQLSIFDDERINSDAANKQLSIFNDERINSDEANQQLSIFNDELKNNNSGIILTQEDFYNYLSADINNSKNKIIIYSPFITRSRFNSLKLLLEGALERNVKIYLITKSLQERNRTEVYDYKEFENIIKQMGIMIIHKKGMHEKLIFVDEDIVWIGSLNILSFSNTQEIMERRESKEIQDAYKRVLMIDKLISCYDKPESVCPICGSEMIASEGAEEPFYWRCINNKCYTRSVDQSYPYGGVITCNSCSGSVEFDYHGNKPCWRCTVNRRHHMSLYKSHLQLSGMKQLIPAKDIKKVLKYFDERH